MDYQKMLSFRNEHSPFMQKLGIVVDEIGPGYARVVKTASEEDENPLGRFHGGCYFTMADIACGASVVSHGKMCVTMDANIQFLRSAQTGDFITAEAHEIKYGKTICVSGVQIKNQKDELLCTGTFSFFVLDQETQF